jgi:hypothetical protein
LARGSSPGGLARNTACGEETNSSPAGLEPCRLDEVTDCAEAEPAARRARGPVRYPITEKTNNDDLVGECGPFKEVIGVTNGAGGEETSDRPRDCWSEAVCKTRPEGVQGELALALGLDLRFPGSRAIQGPHEWS